ncbi:hypothetical protein Tco_0915629 [Tanacetum coccineum]
MFLLNRHQQSYLNYITFLNEKDKPQAATDGIIKHSEAISKSTKVHRKPPQSFTTVIEFLLESIITFVPPSEDKAVVGESSLLLKEIPLMYGPSIHVLVRKDAEFSSSHVLGGLLCAFYRGKEENFYKVNNAFSDFANNCKVQRSLGNDIQAFVDLLDDVLAARLHAHSPTGSSIFGEASATFIDVGLVRSLTQTLHLLDLDHAESLKVTPALVKVLELVTKEHVHAVEANATKTDNQVKPSGNLEHGGVEYTGEVVESFSTAQAYGGSEFVTDDMEHDPEIDGGYAPPSEDDCYGRFEKASSSDNTMVWFSGLIPLLL